MEVNAFSSLPPVDHECCENGGIPIAHKGIPQLRGPVSRLCWPFLGVRDGRLVRPRAADFLFGGEEKTVRQGPRSISVALHVCVVQGVDRGIPFACLSIF